MYNCKCTSIGDAVTTITLGDTIVDTTIGATGTNLTLNNCSVGGAVGAVGNNLAIRNSTVIGAIGNVTGVCVIYYNSEVSTITSIGNNLSLNSSVLNYLTTYNGNSIDIYNSTISEITNMPNLTAILSKNSYIGIADATPDIFFVNDSDITIRLVDLGTGSQTIQLGDTGAGGASGFVRCNIKILAEAQGANVLTLADTTTDTFTDNYIEVYYGGAATFNLRGGVTNRLKRVGLITGVTDTNNNYYRVDEKDYGEMYQFGNVAATVCGVQNTYYIIGNMSTGLVGSRTTGITYAANQLTVARTGIYDVAYSIDILAATADDSFAFAIYVNAAADTKTTIKCRPTTTSNYWTVSGSALLSLAAGNTVELRVANQTAGRNITIADANVRLIQIS
jgi:hypothetical protein